MIKDYFETIVSGIEKSISENPENISPKKKYALGMSRLGKRLYSDTNNVAWCGVCAPFDLLNAMGVTSCFVEYIGAMLASSNALDGPLAASENAGFAADTCGYHRAVIGALEEGLMPEPDFVIATTTPCSGGVAVMENIARHFKKDLFVLNVPLYNDDGGAAFLSEQLKEMVKFVEDHTGDKLDNDKLKNAITHTNSARKYMVEAFDLAKHVPSPLTSSMMGNFGIAMSLLLGSEECVDIVRTYRDDFKEKVEKGIAGVPGEAHRLLWIQNRIQFNNPLIDVLEKEFKAVVVSDELNDILWEEIDPDDPWEGLAKRSISIPFNGNGDTRIDHLKKLAREYKIDGAINPCNWGCRQGSGARGLVSKGLREIGVPVLNLEVDCVDARNFAEGQLKTRIEAFMEMLREQPSPWK